MTFPRPCSCDRVVPGAAFVAGRDCHKCWVFVHRPEVRRAWGGNPDDCDALYPARRTMSVEEMAAVLAGPRVPMPEGWRFWPVTRAAHKLLADRFVERMPPYPEGRFAGRGAVICGGGRYEASVYVACRMLRHVGWDHPIQVWHRGAAEPVSDRVRRLPGVEVVDAEAHPARPARRTMGGWESKSFAILNCRFEEVLFLDADCYPLYDPDVCFEPEHNPHGVVLWSNDEVADGNTQWASYELPPDGRASLTGGHYVLTMRRAWALFQLAQHFDDHSDYYYCHNMPSCAGDVGGLGDQDQLRVALHRLGVPDHRYAPRPLLSTDSLVLAGPHGRPLFVHRYLNKFGRPGDFHSPPRWTPTGLPLEATVWRYFLEWLTLPVPGAGVVDEIPGRFTPAECALWGRACAGRDVLELGRHLGRSTTVAALAARSVVSLDRASAAEAGLWLERYGVRHKAWLREGEFAALVPTSGGPFSACLIDGGHDAHSVSADIAAVAPHLTPGAVVGFHDYADPNFPDVKPVADAAARERGWRFLDRADHLAVFVTGAR